LLLNPGGQGKLSKRTGDELGFPVFPMNWVDPKTGKDSMGYKEKGYIPQAFINFLAFLGWNPGTEQEIFSLQQLIEAFSIDRVGKSGSKFDPEKAKWFNHQYLKQKSNSTLANLFAPVLIEKNICVDIKYIEEVCGLMKERVNFMSELWDKSSFFFVAPIAYDPKLIKDKWKENSKEILFLFSEKLANIDTFDIISIDAFINEFLTAHQLGKGQLMPLLRLCLDGNSTGPDITQIFSFIGKTESVNRINNCIQNVK